MTNSVSMTDRFLHALEAPQGNRPLFNNVLEKTKTCIRGYSTKQGCLNKLKGLIYRIWNAIKAIVGQSDWQRAKRALENRNFKFIETNKEKMHQLDLFLNTEYPEELSYIEDADSLLYALIKLHESPTIRDMILLNKPGLSENEKNKINGRLEQNPRTDAAYELMNQFPVH